MNLVFIIVPEILEMFFWTVVIHCTIHVEHPLLAWALRWEQDGVNINQHNFLVHVFCSFLRFFWKKRNLSSPELVELVFLTLSFYPDSFPNVIIPFHPRYSVTSPLQPVLLLHCDFMHLYCLLSAAKKENKHFIDFCLCRITNSLLVWQLLLLLQLLWKLSLKLLSNIVESSHLHYKYLGAECHWCK